MVLLWASVGKPLVAPADVTVMTPKSLVATVATYLVVWLADSQPQLPAPGEEAPPV